MKVLAMISRIIHQFIRDKRSLALLIFAPLLILTLTWLVLDQEAGDLKVVTIDVPEKIETALADQGVEIVDSANPEQAVKDGELDAVIMMEESQLKITVDNSQPNTSQAVRMMLQKAFSPQQSNMNLQFNDVYSVELATTFDYVGPILIGYFAFFFVFLVGGISFLREKSQGTMERLFTTPIKSWEVIVGYIGGFGLFAVIQSFVVVLFSVYILGIPLEGSLWFVILITLLLALTALTLGTLLSTFAKNEFQMMQFIPIVIVPQAFFSGMFNLENAPNWVEAIGKIMPMNYGSEALTEIMIKGNEFAAIWLDITVLLGFSCVFFILNLLTLVSYRK